MDLDQAVVIALGSNLEGRHGSSEALLEAALARFADVGLTVLHQSSWWRSAAWPDPLQPEYRNGVAIVETDHAPEAVLAGLLAIEAGLDRQRGVRNAPRTLDLDLIAHGRELRHDPGLILPHPRAHQRRFVMGPLAQIAPTWRHPVSGETAASLARTAKIGTDASPT